MPTPYHATYLAHRLTVSGEAGNVESIGRSLQQSRVDLNPHQVDAALFALRSPYSQGAILADEVGLGKTIEAGIILTQYWAERKRRILLIVPATLRKQWQAELSDKFGLPSTVIDGPAIKEAKPLNALDTKGARVAIVSYDLASRYSEHVRRVPWDLVVVDEAHRLRNVYQASSVTAANIRDATAGRQKLLLTATPLQNSLAELYGLVSVIDERVFGDIKTFREQFTRRGADADYADLQERLRPLVARTLRKQVTEFINFTRRTALTADFEFTPDEQELYEGVSELLRTPDLLSLPAGQRPLMTLVLRKLLASSTFAIAGTLTGFAARVKAQLDPSAQSAPTVREITADYEARDEESERKLSDVKEPVPSNDPDPISPEEEYRELTRLARLAESITANAKGEKLVSFLPEAFARATALGAARKAVIFTESRRTQRSLFDRLYEAGYAGQIVCINGENRDLGSPAIYQRWLDRHRGSDKISGAKAADMKASLVEEFRDTASILLATESAAEGVNLQFASLLINYDLPWNPQRVEQRIGRVHRYGQQHDVVVVNFLNRSNAADKRVHELLSDKFNLFDGVFGASDEILGALESGVDLEKRIAQIYQEARTQTEIQAAFDDLQAEIADVVEQRMLNTRAAVLDHLDDEVAKRLQVYRDEAKAALNRREEDLLELTRIELGDAADFKRDEPAFTYTPVVGDPTRYHLDWREAEAQDCHFYHQETALAQEIIARAQARRLPIRRLHFDYTGDEQRFTPLEELVGREGWLRCTRLEVSAGRDEQFVLLTGCTDDGEAIDPEDIDRMLRLRANVAGEAVRESVPDALHFHYEVARGKRVEQLANRDNSFFEVESEKLDRYAEDLKFGLEAELRELEALIREARKDARRVTGLESKLEGQKRVKALEKLRKDKRQRFYDASDEIERQRDELIAEAEARLAQRVGEEVVWEVRWVMD